MSSFICKVCGINSIDTESGYISGCKHYPPDRDGEYQVKVFNEMTRSIETESMRFTKGSWVNQYNEVIEWHE